MWWGQGFSSQSPFGMWLQAFGSSTQQKDKTSIVFTWRNFAEGDQMNSGHSLESEELVPGSLPLEGHQLSSSSGSNWSDAFPPLAEQTPILWKMHENGIQKMHLEANTDRISHEWNWLNLQSAQILGKCWWVSSPSPWLSVTHRFPISEIHLSAQMSGSLLTTRADWTSDGAAGTDCSPLAAAQTRRETPLHQEGKPKQDRDWGPSCWRIPASARHLLYRKRYLV